MHRIVIVGGGAGGLALATQLGKRLGRHKRAEVTLVDAARTHVWKPLLHQLAAGSYDTHAQEIEYLAQAHSNHFRFRLGHLIGIDRTAKTVQLAASHDDTGLEITPAQQLGYDTLVLAVGSQTNDFGTQGAQQHTIKLDTPQAARRFNDMLINSFIRAQTVPLEKGRLTVAIVGGGATGVELAAELHASAKVLASYGFDHVHPERDLRIVLVEAAPRLLSQLPERLSAAALRELRKLSIEVFLEEKVVEVSAGGLKMASGKFIDSNLTVWAAGVKADEALRSLGGADPLETNRLNQLVVSETLQTTRDPHIYAFGDCAACPQPGDTWVPPRAQSAYQQAMYLARTLPVLTGLQATTKEVSPFRYTDQGSLVSLASYSSVGSLMGSLTKGSMFIEGFLAKTMYWGLHKQHQFALGGLRKTVLITLSELIDRAYRPRIKLH
jgi:NADH dehydrogenase